MSRPRKDPYADAQTALTAAVNNIGLALNTLQQVFERNGAELNASQHNKAFSFLGQTLDAIEVKTRLSLTSTVLTQGKFTLDMELPTPLPASPHAAAHNLHLPPGVRAGAPVRGPRVLTEPGPAAPAGGDEDLKELNLETSEIPGVGFIED